MGLIGEMRELIESDARWGRVLAVESRRWRRAVLRVEVHEGDRPPVERTIATTLPRGVEPRVGQDLFVTPVRGEFFGVEQPYRIHWGREPRYGTPALTEDETRGRDAVAASAFAHASSPATPADPRWQLDFITAEHAAGRMSDADFERYRAGLQAYL